MLQCWQEDPEDRPSFSQLRSNFSSMLQAGATAEYIDLQVDEAAPYYRVRDEDLRERRDSASSASSGDSISSIDKEKGKSKQKVKKMRSNPYVTAPNQGETSGYFDVLGPVQERPLGIPISQLMSPPQNGETPIAQNGGGLASAVDESAALDHPALERCSTNPYVTEPSESITAAQVAENVPQLATIRDEQEDREGVRESTHL